MPIMQIIDKIPLVPVRITDQKLEQMPKSRVCGAEVMQKLLKRMEAEGDEEGKW